MDQAIGGAANAAKGFVQAGANDVNRATNAVGLTRPVHPQLPTRPQAPAPQFHMPTLPSVNSRIPGLGVSPANITAQIPHAFGQVGNAGVQVGNQLLGDVSHLSDVISYPIVTKQYQDMANKGQISQATASHLMNEAGQKAGFNIGDKGATVLRKTAGAVAMPTATILTAGAAPEAVAGVKGLSLGAKVAQGVKAGVPVGAGFGALSTLGQQDKITPLGAATNIVGGGLMGGALGAGIPLAGAGLSKLARPVINDLKAGAPALANQSGHANFNAPIDKQGAINEAQAQIKDLNNQIAAHQGALEQAKLQINQNPMLKGAQKDAQLRALDVHANQLVNNVKQELAGWNDHLNQLGGSPILQDAKTTGVPVDTRMPYDPAPPTTKQKIVANLKDAANVGKGEGITPKPGFLGTTRAILADQRGSVDLNAPLGKEPIKPQYGTLDEFKNKYSVGFDGVSRLKTNPNGSEFWGKDQQMSHIAKNNGIHSTEDLYKHLNRDVAPTVRAKVQAPPKPVEVPKTPDITTLAGKNGKELQANYSRLAHAETRTPQEQAFVDHVDAQAAKGKLPGQIYKGLNTSRLNVSEQAKTDIGKMSVPDEVARMTNKEVEDLSRTAGIDLRSHSIEQQRKIIAQQLNVRQQIVTLSNQADKLLAEGNTTERVKLLKQIRELSQTSREQGSEIGRALQARKITANELATPMQRIFQLLDHAGVNPDVYMERAAKLDFNDGRAVVNFYRSLVPPKATDWINLVRYNSMLSSPTTNIINISSTAGNIGVAPVEKEVTAVLDHIQSFLPGHERKYAHGEGVDFVTGALSPSNLKKSIEEFKNVYQGKDKEFDMGVQTGDPRVPIAATGSSKLVDTLDFPMRVLGAFDSANKQLVRGGTLKGMNRRAGQGIRTLGNSEISADAEAAYRTFNQPIGDKSNGYVLGAIDQLTHVVMGLTNAKNPVVKWPATLSMPFVRIGSNLLKHGIEYSPAGFATVPGSTAKSPQLAKAMIGVAMTGMAGTLVGQNRLTWQAPTDKTKKQAWDTAHMQPYSVKIGGTWVDYSKLPPFLSFNFALAASLDDAIKHQKLNETGVDNIVNAVAGFGGFMADQSYMKNVGDALTAIKGGADGLTNLIANYPQQMIPFRAFTGWLARMTDGTQRQINTDASFVAKQTESLMQQYPWFRQHTTAKTDSGGNPIAANHPFINSFSPAKISTEDPANADIYRTMEQATIDKSNKTAADNQAKKLLDGTQTKSGKNSVTTDSNGNKTVTTTDGKVMTKINGEYKTFDNQAKADTAVAKDAFDKSGKNYQVSGDTVFRRDSSGNVTATPKVKFDYQVGTATLTKQKNAGDIQGWMKTAQSQIDSINKQLNDPSVDPLDATTLQNDAVALMKSMKTYAGYGGFTKGKTAKAIKVPKLPSTTKIAKFNIKTPKVPTVKVAVATPKFKAPKAIRAPKVAKALPRRTVKIAKLPKSRNVA